jgi:Ser/Thr protein kinase RdoA (MazF antagonist)
VASEARRVRAYTTVSEHVLQPVLSHYGLASPSVRIEPLANAGGWSGSLLWRVTDAKGRQFCLRRWPTEHPSSERLQFIHNVLLHVGQELPLVASPIATGSRATFIHHAGHLWELTSWLPGIADFHAHPTPARLRAALHVLVRFHNLAARFQSQTGPAPAVIHRLQQLQTLDHGELFRIEQSLATPLHKDLDAVAARLIAALKQRLQRQIPPSPVSAASQLHLQPAIRDIHHDHLLFTSDSVTGLIDFGALRIDTPLTDIARLLGSLVADDQKARTTALNAYAELRPLTDTDRQLIDWLDQTGLILSALNWLRWLYIERRNMGPSAPIIHRISKITLRLENHLA